MNRTALLASFVASAGLIGSALASTEAEKNAAITKGLEWLAKTQLGDGSWATYGGFNQAGTGAALLSLEDKGFKAGTPVVINGTDYGDVVGKGLNYLFNTVALHPQGIDWGGSEATYVTGLVIPGITKSGTPDAIIGSGPLAGSTYKQAVQKALDYFAYYQAPPSAGTSRGGWRYSAGRSDSDNSTAQWPPLAMLFAQPFGASVSPTVKDELKHWISYIQNPTSGGAGYDSPFSLVNEAKTGGLLLEMAFAGSDLGGMAYSPSHPKTKAALDYLNANWMNTANSTWDGNFGHPYAMWSVYKGLELTIGKGDTTHITNLHPPGTIDPGYTWNWWEDYCDSLVKSQTADGSWSGYSYWGSSLATAWDINILAATEIPGKKTPESSQTLALLGMALAALAGLRRSQK
jgi:hypothetical protein